MKIAFQIWVTDPKGGKRGEAAIYTKEKIAIDEVSGYGS